MILLYRCYVTGIAPFLGYGCSSRVRDMDAAGNGGGSDTKLLTKPYRNILRLALEYRE
jgi:hypothetical protein